MSSRLAASSLVRLCMLARTRRTDLLDRRLPGDGVVARWFDWEQHVRQLGVGWRLSFGRWPFSSVDGSRLGPGQAYDLVFHVPEAPPVVPQ